jgi:hypothetical protein
MPTQENQQLQDLCLSLIRADSEAEVIQILKDAGHWDNPTAWRFYGDNENNQSTAGNQMASSDAALVEKLINSIDAVLTNECYGHGIYPDSAQAPKGIEEAVEKFFGDGLSGKISLWPKNKRTEVAQRITLAVTGNKPATTLTGTKLTPCISIADNGEGQTPEQMPDTLLSLNRSNKLRIPFVQGKFNMGGTGTLRFCGTSHIQLIVSKRNPKLVSPFTGGHATDSMWGFTVVRQEDGKEGARSSTYTYLAPVDMQTRPNRGGVLRFEADSLALFPQANFPYKRPTQWGTLIKLYEYYNSNYGNSHILRTDGLLSRLDLRLPGVALPIRLHECRDYKGEEGSFDTTLSGLRVRMDDDAAKNLEADCCSTCPIQVNGEECVASIFAFKPGKAGTYRKSEGVIFTVNGQTHGDLHKNFFTRKSVGRLSYIKDDLLVIVDCSKFSTRAREDLFPNSRDRISECELRKALEHELEYALSIDKKLGELVHQRRQEKLKDQLKDNKPLESVLQRVLKSSPTLSRLFIMGNRLTNPFNTQMVHTTKKNTFKGKRHPTYFKFKGREYGKIFDREAHLGSKCRVTFETDVVNDYFDRARDRGESSVQQIDSAGNATKANSVGPKPQDGIANLSVSLPDVAKIGDVITYTCRVTDDTLIEDFVNTFRVTVLPAAAKKPGGNGPSPDRPDKNKPGNREIPTGISLPKINWVTQAEWQEHKFDKYSALKVVTFSDDKKKEQDLYDFYVNADNIYLKTEQKHAPDATEVLKEKFGIALSVLGLALLLEDSEKKKDQTTSDENPSPESDGESDETIEDTILNFTRAVAPVLLPMIAGLNELEVEDSLIAVSE